jgi:hypothetical protein
MTNQISESAGNLQQAARLPNFVIAGAAKSGTSFAASRLSRHPDIFLPTHKECSYFAFQDDPPRFTGPGDDLLNRMVISDLNRYRELFRDAGARPVVGEASVIYLARPSSFARMRATLGPGVKAIVLLRNPADRAFSAWSHLVRDGREKLSFRDALAAEPDRIAAGWEPLWAYRSSGYYAEQLRTAFAELGRANVGVWLYDDVQERPLDVLHDMCRFLEVPVDGFRPNTEARVNASGVPRSAFVNWLAYGVRHRFKLGWLLPVPAVRERIKTRIGNANLRPLLFDPRHRAELVEEFAGEIESLATLLERDLRRWHEPAAASAID